MKLRSKHARTRVLLESLETRQMLDATALKIVTFPSDSVAGESIGTIKVYVMDDDNHVVTSNTSSVTLSINEDTGGDGATLGGTTTVAAVKGVATFTGISITKAADNYSLHVADGELDSDDTDTFDITPAAVNAVTYHTAPDDGTAGEALDDVVVYTVDKYSNVVTDYNGTVNVAISTAPVAAETVNGTIAVNADNGVATFDDLTLETAGNYKLTASIGKLTAVSGEFSISAGAADHLVFAAVPVTTVAGASMTPVKVKILDAYDNLVTDADDEVQLATETGPSSSQISVDAVAGVATFSEFGLNIAGAYTLGASSGDLGEGVSGVTTVTPTAAAKLAFKTAPSKTVAGSAMSLAVTVQDQYNNIVTTDKSKVTITLDGETSPEGSKLTGNATATVAAGVATFSGLSLTAAGAYKVKFADGSLTGLTSEAFSVTPAAAAKILFGQVPTAVVAGAKMTSVTVKVQDKFGNDVTSDRSKATIAIASAPTGATIANTMTARASGGTTTFSKISLNKAGSYTFKVTNGKLPAITSAAIVVSPAVAAKLVTVSGPLAAAKVVAGVKFAPIVVQVQDKFGNVVIGDSSTVSASIMGNFGSLTGTASVAAVKGIATFSTLAINTASDYTLKFNDSSLKASKSNAFSITPAAAAKLLLGNQPDDVTAGETISPIGVFILDQYNNQVTTDVSKVTVAVTGAVGAKLLGTATVTASAGFAGFTDLKTTLTGTDKLTFTDGKLVAATTETFVVTPDEAAKIVLTTQPAASTKAGVALTSVVAKVQDQFGNIVADNESELTIEVATGPEDASELDGTAAQTAEAGVATFDDLKLTTAGTYTLKVTGEDLTAATSTAAVITPNVAKQLVIKQDVSNAVAGVAISPVITVQVLDEYDNLVTTDASKVTVAIAADTGAENGKLNGSASTVVATAVKGVATFAGLNITQAGEAYQLKFTDGTLTSATSEEFDITAAAAAKLVFGTVPASTTTGEEIPEVTVTVVDKFNNVCTDNSSSITLSVTAGTTGAVLGGTKTVAAEDGVATFADLTLDKAGTYTLKAIDGSLTLATLAGVKITAAT